MPTVSEATGILPITVNV